MLYISTVSHNHFSLIKESGCIAELAKDSNIKILVRDNIGESGFYEWCKERGIYYFSNTKSLGFGQNNNLNFSFLPPSDADNNDYFLVLNPDVIVTRNVLRKLIRKMHELDIQLATINLFLDLDFTRPDNSVRKFPSFFDFIFRFIFGGEHSVIDKSKLNQVTEVDWAAGSFLMFSREVYRKLNGFDEKFFMYCEDIDICARYFQKFGKKISIFPDLLGTHIAMHNNRKIFSKHFFWHLVSVFRYLLKSKSLF
jgi:hypothetical protein